MKNTTQSQVQRFRKKPLVIEAQQYLDPSQPTPGMVVDCAFYSFCPNVPHVHTLEGPLRVSIGDWIVKGVQGEFYPVKPEIFEATYEPENPV